MSTGARQSVTEAAYRAPNVVWQYFYNVLLAELWLELESCHLVGLPPTSINQQATGSKGKSNVAIPEETQ